MQLWCRSETWWEKLLFKLGINEMVPTVQETEFNFKGAVPDDLTWNKACEWSWPSIKPMIEQIPPTHCPECGLSVIQKSYDWWNIEDSGQYMVWTVQCPNKHGAWIECA